MVDASRMQCDDVRENLVAFVDGELPVQEQQLVVSHIDSCPACRAELEHERALTLRLAQVLDVEPRPFDGSLAARVRERAAASDVTSHRWVLALAAATLVAVTAWFFFSKEDAGQDVVLPKGDDSEKVDTELLSHLDLLEDIDAVGVELDSDLVQLLLDGGWEDSVPEEALEEELLEQL